MHTSVAAAAEALPTTTPPPLHHPLASSAPVTAALASASASAPPSATNAKPDAKNHHHHHHNHKMLFSVHKSKPKTRGAPPLEAPAYDAELLSKDKVKQKEAVRRYMAEHVRSDWTFEWQTKEDDGKESGGAAEAETEPGAETAPDPARETVGLGLPEETPVAKEAKGYPGNELDLDSDTGSIYSTISCDSIHYRARLEWTSDLSDDEPLATSPYQFESPDSVGAAIRAGAQAKKDKRRRAIRDEARWNTGLACFESRRNAWTEARIVRVKHKPITPKESLSPLSQRRFFFRGSFSLPGSPTTAVPASGGPTTPAQAQAQSQATHLGHQDRTSRDASITFSDSSDPMSITSKTTKSTTPPPSPYPVEILLPLAPPILPPLNPMRSGITPAVYLPLYDRLVSNNLAPYCPINLQDMLRACVCGWKRDGEWPPRPTMVVPLPAGRNRRKKHEGRESGNLGGSIGRRMSFGFLGREKDAKDAKEAKEADKAAEEDEHGKGIRKSLQRVLGIGHHGHHEEGKGGQDVVSPTSPVARM